MRTCDLGERLRRRCCERSAHVAVPDQDARAGDRREWHAGLQLGLRKHTYLSHARKGAKGMERWHDQQKLSSRTESKFRQIGGKERFMAHVVSLAHSGGERSPGMIKHILAIAVGL